MKKYILITSFIFVFVIGGAFIFHLNNVNAAVLTQNTDGIVTITDGNIIITPAINTGSNVAVNKTVNYAAVPGASSYRIVFLDKEKNKISEIKTTATSYDATNIVGADSWQVSAINAYGESKLSNITPFPIVSNTNFTKMAVVPNQALNSSFDFAPLDAKILAMEKAMKTLTAMKKAELAKAKAADLAYSKQYGDARNAILTLKKKNNTLNANKAAKALEDLKVKEDTALKAINALNVKLNNVNELMKKIEVPKVLTSDSSGTITLDPTAKSVTINSGMVQGSSFFDSVERNASYQVAAKSDTSGTITINTDNTVTISPTNGTNNGSSFSCFSGSSQCNGGWFCQGGGTFFPYYNYCWSKAEGVHDVHVL